MKVVAAIDSFKGSLSTFQAGEALAVGVKRVYPDAQVLISPLADGGEGTVEAIVGAAGGTMVEVTVHNPLGRLIQSQYGMVEATKTAIIEMASASGITLIEASERNPLVTTTFGVGELILDAIEKGCRQFVIGIGGSATNDCGVGMLQALGFSFLDEKGNPVGYGANGVKQIAAIQTVGVHPALKDCEFRIACDVKNPLCGELGCSAVYGPQKGATPLMVEEMDGWLHRFAELTKTVNPDADPDYPGSGAAGGLGFAFMSYLGGTLTSGIELVIKETGLEELVKDADVVVTGEGRLDGQSHMGKAPIGVAKLAKQYGKTVLAFSGCVTRDAVKCNDHGIDAFFPILRTPCTLEEAMDAENAFSNMSDTVEQVFRLLKIAKGLSH
ncbi:MAG: glycerate kinase [Ruminococcaceae bacterium]|nr:glycerate kinase [Oscillospiraceae bacterium]